MSVVHITKQNFENEVLKSDKPVLLDFFAGWCAPCRMLGPILDKIAAEHPEYKICKVDVDAEPDLAARFGVMSIPSLFVLKQGEVVNKAMGAMPEGQLLALLR